MEPDRLLCEPGQRLSLSELPPTHGRSQREAESPLEVTMRQAGVHGASRHQPRVRRARRGTPTLPEGCRSALRTGGGGAQLRQAPRALLGNRPPRDLRLLMVCLETEAAAGVLGLRTDSSKATDPLRGCWCHLHPLILSDTEQLFLCPFGHGFVVSFWKQPVPVFCPFFPRGSSVNSQALGCPSSRQVPRVFSSAGPSPPCFLRSVELAPSRNRSGGTERSRSLVYFSDKEPTSVERNRLSQSRRPTGNRGERLRIFSRSQFLSTSLS